ncbi:MULTISPECIES: GGDEF domain-containing protein [Thiorhodovibrio]|uniref:GGDEF domain-containing protein n=1 Tax=Thiorhodovibrio TaxID=61593 RepID=UPI001911422E|nr:MULTISPECIES: GGDEF domain-containing protein [Thiorhodovibrio]WPL11610.1 Cyclic di-GMP phosphodiesterase Gmr [Thiorhodovibrio litoralis]
MAATESNREPNPGLGPGPDRAADQATGQNDRRAALRLFLGVVLLSGVLVAGGAFLFYRAELSDAAAVVPEASQSLPQAGEAGLSQTPPAALASAGGQGAKAERRGTLIRLWVFSLVIFLAMVVGGWFLVDARMKWIREKKRAQTLADFDFVTNLPNRALFFDRLERIHLHSARYRRSYGLIVMDLDGFGEVNEKFGYSDGDQLLIRVGRMLTNSLRYSDTVARIGGDEFAVLLTEVSDVGAAMMLGKKMAAAISAPIRLPGGYAEITASIGVAVFPEHGSSVDDILQAADQAMDRAKREGQGICLLALSPDEYPDTEDLAAGLVVAEEELP